MMRTGGASGRAFFTGDCRTVLVVGRSPFEVGGGGVCSAGSSAERLACEGADCMGASSIFARAAASVGRAAVDRCGAVLSRPDARDFSSSVSDNFKPAIVDVGMFVLGEAGGFCCGGEYWVAASTIFTRGRAGGLDLSRDLVLGSR
jgi:hypothetical protein